MVFLSRILYGFFIRIASFALGLTGWFKPNIKAWLHDRKNSFRSIQNHNTNIDEEWIWMHCSSLGEYEQGRPVLEEFKTQQPEKKIIVTFFSPSGYNQIKKDSVIDRVEYLPFDYKKCVKVFIDKFKPSIGIFVKYDLWPEAIIYASNNGVRLFLISAVFNSPKWFLSNRAGIFNHAFEKFAHIFVQNSISKDFLHAQGYKNISITGDSRIDRVYTLSTTPFANQKIETWLGHKKCIIFGSTHSGSDDIVVKTIIDKYRNAFPGEYKFLIFPHHIHLARIEEISQTFSEATIYSNSIDVESDLMVVDMIGILSKSYRYANLVYIGGGFGKSVHNLLEPAVYGNRLICGHKIKGFPEAEDFKAMKVLSILDDPNTFLDTDIFFKDMDKECAKKLFEKYFSEKIGVSKKIFDTITKV